MPLGIDTKKFKFLMAFTIIVVFNKRLLKQTNFFKYLIHKNIKYEQNYCLKCSYEYKKIN